MTKDPYRYFRIEARELLDGITQGALQIEKGSAREAEVASLLRLAHTLKGAARVVKQSRIGDSAHAMEDILARYRESPIAVPRECAAELLRLADAVASRLANLDAPREAETAPSSAPRPEESFETVRVDVEDLEGLMQGLSEVRVQIGAMQEEIDSMKRAQHLAAAVAARAHAESNTRANLADMADQLRNVLRRMETGLSGALRRAERELTQTNNRAQRLRLLPASVLFPSLERAIRDAAVTLGKEAEFEVTGGDVRLDAQILIVLRHALLHLVRNAVAHGIEPPQVRVAAGKPAAGRVGLRIVQRGPRVAFCCSDDGGGIDPAAVRMAGVKAGLIGAVDSAPLNSDEAIRLILRGGISTSGSVTGIAGRGVGLDIVSEAARRFQGEISIRTEQGRGTTVEVLVPASLISMNVLAVDVGGMIACVPLTAVRRVMSIPDTQIVRTGAQESVAIEGRAMPFLRLARMLRPTAAPELRRKVWPVVIVSAGNTTAAIGVDRLANTGTVLAKTLPPQAGIAPLVCGACLDLEGNPQLVLDPVVLTSAQPAVSVLPQAPTNDRGPVLVIDDSLTTRMLEQNILQSAGYEVDLAISGEEALEKTKSRNYSLFLVDVEMPGMDGFEFLSHVRADPAIRETPAILVTSRNSAADKSRGRELGACAYIVKSEFNQQFLLNTIRGLVGGL